MKEEERIFHKEQIYMVFIPMARLLGSSRFLPLTGVTWAHRQSVPTVQPAYRSKMSIGVPSRKVHVYGLTVEPL